MAFRLTPPRPEVSEQDVIQASIKILGMRGWWCRRNVVGRFRTMSDSWVDIGPTGIPDYTAYHAKYPAFFLEFKRPGKTLRPAQVSRFAEIQFGFKLAAVMVATTQELVDFLKGHEARAVKALSG